jgi:uncharacterized protein (TIGR02611 family)
MLLKSARKVVVALIGGTVVLLGVLMLVTPGPGLLVIPLGLAILATEFVFAARLLRRLREKAAGAAAAAGFRRPAPAPDAVDRTPGQRPL